MPNSSEPSVSRGNRHRSRRNHSREPSNDDAKSSSPLPSPGSWLVDRGRSRVRRPSNPFSEESLRRRGYHSLLSSFGKVFHVERRWKLIRELGCGAYGVVISAADEISGETVAIKMVTRVFDKIQLAKRALREITLLRHFANHENITGLIDVDAITRDFNEIYIFMEPMEADLHQIIKSGQSLTNEHVQYFLYQILRGMKYVHSASVIHRDLKPGNLLVNADCELKICDFGLSRGFDSGPDEHATHLTEYVATRWYRAPEIMLAFNRYSTAIDVWSIGCILAELMLGKPLFKGKDYVDQVNKILEVLGTPDENIIERIGSEKAQAYVRSLPPKRTIPFRKLLLTADPQAIDLITQMLTFDPTTRITVMEALEHPWLASYHDVADEPECPTKFEAWRKIEELETLDEFREALWKEIEDYRREVRSINLDLSTLSLRRSSHSTSGQAPPTTQIERHTLEHSVAEVADDAESVTEESATATATAITITGNATDLTGQPERDVDVAHLSTQDQLCYPTSPTDPVVTYARRSSLMQPSRQASTYNSPRMSSHQHLPAYVDGHSIEAGGVAGIPTQGYVVPGRSRTTSIAGGEVARKLLRTLSTVSIHESTQGLAGGLAKIAPIGRYIVDMESTAADAPASEMPRDFGISDHEISGGRGESSDGRESEKQAANEKEKKEGRFRIG